MTTEDTQRRRTLLLLGGSQQQVVAIEEAKRCGYRTVLCDYLPDNPGQHVADKFYLVSTTDREAVLDVARIEHAGGVIAYSSDPAAPTAAYVAEELGLPTNPLAAVEILSGKHLFRAHMQKTGLPCPQSFAFSSGSAAELVWEKVRDFHMPVVIKPTDSSGSKGVTILSSSGELPQAISYAASRSRNATLICEEYIERVFPYVVGGDIFVVNGRVVFWGLMSCLRDDACKLVPVGKKTPSGLSQTQCAKVKNALQELVSSLGIEFGELNVEVILGKDDVPYVLELGARAGGNMIPLQLSDVSGINLIRANVMCAMGDDPGELSWEPGGEDCCATYVLHTVNCGAYAGLQLSDAIAPHVYRKVIYQKPGAPVAAFDGADKALGILFMRFDIEAQMNKLLERISEHVRVDLVPCVQDSRGGALIS